jgi:hypothetical protein
MGYWAIFVRRILILNYGRLIKQDNAVTLELQYPLES